VSRAADRLYVSQPAISKQLKDLEQELGVALFERTPAGVELTPAGETFLVHARDVLRRAALAAESMGAFRGAGGGGRLAIGYLPTTMPAFLAGALGEFAAAHPHAAVELRELSPGEQIEELAAGRLDLAFVGNACPELHGQYTVQAVERLPFVAALPAAHALAQSPALDLAGLAGESFVGFDERRFPGRNQLICDLCRAAGFTPPLDPRADSLVSALAFVGARRGVALMPADVARLPHPQVVFVPLAGPPVYVESAVVLRPEDGANRLVRAFLALLTKSA
jgi:DNA-binding transcriptional LysR family regulator